MRKLCPELPLFFCILLLVWFSSEAGAEPGMVAQFTKECVK
jgi:hypothetical protein